MSQYTKKLKILERQLMQTTPSIYASIAIALSEAGMSNEVISDVFAESQAIWAEHMQEGTLDDMIQMCADRTGIQMYSTEDSEHTEGGQK